MDHLDGGWRDLALSGGVNTWAKAVMLGHHSDADLEPHAWRETVSLPSTLLMPNAACAPKQRPLLSAMEIRQVAIGILRT